MTFAPMDKGYHVGRDTRGAPEENTPSRTRWHAARATPSPKDKLAANEALVLWQHAFGEGQGLIATFSGMRRGPGKKTLEGPRTAFFRYPEESIRAWEWLRREDGRGRETYYCAHLLMGRGRVKANAAPLFALYVDGDGARPMPGMPEPPVTVRSSPGREQFYYPLTEPVAPEIGERLNRRLALAMGADDSGWDLTQLLRVPGTHNHKYADAPIVRLVEVSDTQYVPGALHRSIPVEPEARPKPAKRIRRPEKVDSTPDLSRLSPRMRDVVRFGNRGEYRSRSEADFAACLAMFAAGYSEMEVWAAMTDPALGISEKFLEKGRDGEQYLGCTIGKAGALAQASPGPKQGKVYARREVVVRLGQ